MHKYVFKCIYMCVCVYVCASVCTSGTNFPNIGTQVSAVWGCQGDLTVFINPSFPRGNAVFVTGLMNTVDVYH